MTKKTKSKAELEAEINILRTGHIASSITKILTTTIKFGCFVLIASYVRDCVVSFAGESTIGQFEFNTNLIANLTSNNSFVALAGLIFGSSGITYGIAQRYLKRKTVSHLSRRKEKLEKLIDSGRHSSRLTKKGTTRPEDL